MELNFQSHETLKSRALIDLYLKPVTPLHVGRGGVEFLNEAVHFKIDERIVPFIPSESIKGVLRASATRLAEHIPFQNPEIETALRGHRKDVHEIDGEELSGLETKAEKLKAYFDDQQWEEIRDKKVELYLSIHCPICRLFGSRYLAGKLLFYDAIPSTEVRLSTYTGIAINRKTRTVEERKLFKTQYVVPADNLSFWTRIIADNITGTPEAKLFALLLENILHEGLKMGGKKSIGYGLMMLEGGRTKVKYVEFNIKPTDYDQKLENVKRILFDEKFHKSLRIEEYIDVLRQGISF
jgi:CRISPR/Cas system CSM-associated protein Csm3 (group 7 of RAMP superfamily)